MEERGQSCFVVGDVGGVSYWDSAFDDDEVDGTIALVGDVVKALI